MHSKWKFMPLLAGALLACSVRAADAPASPDAATRHQLVGAVVKALKEHYRLPAQAEQIGRDLLAREARGEYAVPANGAELASKLTADMQAISGDLHMNVKYREPGRAGPAPMAGGGERNVNWGIRQADILDDNIGYLRIDKFGDLSQGGAALAAAMQLLSNTDALVIDLRNNKGGGVMIMLLASYFFDGEPELLQTIHYPRMGESLPFTTQAWVPGARYLNKPVYVLTSKRTFSAGEAFAYAMQSFERATIVGEVTSGGANPITFIPAVAGFQVSAPVGETIGARTKGNWEGKGVQPDVVSAETAALPKALELAKAALVKAGKS